MRKLIALLTALVLVTTLAACGDDGDDTTTTTAGATATTAEGSSSTVADEDLASVKVYFALNEAVATAGRTVAAPAVGKGAVEALLTGPEGIEVEMGMTTEIPEGTELLGLDIADGVATVDLSSEFETGGGSLSMQLRVAQVVFTLTQFDTVDTVEFRIDGAPVTSIGGEGVMVDGVDRSSFTNVTPAVLIESPVPGEAVSSPLEITGMANTFEATVNYSVTDGDGLIVTEGFTTATAGMGTFGTFSVTATFSVPTPGVGSVIGFEISPEDGTQTNVYEGPRRHQLTSTPTAHGSGGWTGASPRAPVLSCGAHRELPRARCRVADPRSISPPAPTEPGAHDGFAFQPGLEGMRGVAVLAVLVFHGGFSWASGGFLGVSTFFTLSGFLITTLLLRERHGTGSVSLKRFWGPSVPSAHAGGTRLPRGACWSSRPTVATPAQIVNLRGDVLASLAYVANWRFIADGPSYAELFTAPSPVLHFWSLAIEEQFYLVFPLAVAGSLALAKGSRRLLVGLLAIGTVGSIALTASLAESSNDAAYYNTFTRAASCSSAALLAMAVALPATRRALDPGRAKAAVTAPGSSPRSLSSGCGTPRRRPTPGCIGAGSPCTPCCRRCSSWRRGTRPGAPGAVHERSALARPDLLRGLPLPLADLPVAQSRPHGALGGAAVRAAHGRHPRGRGALLPPDRRARPSGSPMRGWHPFVVAPLAVTLVLLGIVRVATPPPFDDRISFAAEGQPEIWSSSRPRRHTEPPRPRSRSRPRHRHCHHPKGPRLHRRCPTLRHSARARSWGCCCGDRRWPRSAWGIQSYVAEHGHTLVLERTPSWCGYWSWAVAEVRRARDRDLRAATRCADTWAEDVAAKGSTSRASMGRTWDVVDLKLGQRPVADPRRPGGRRFDVRGRSPTPSTSPAQGPNCGPADPLLIRTGHHRTAPGASPSRTPPHGRLNELLVEVAVTPPAFTGRRPRRAHGCTTSG